MANPLKLRGQDAARIKERVTSAANLLEIGELLHRRPQELSGGQKQRVAIGRAIVREPKLFLFDEPIAHLDAKLRAHMRGEIKHLQRTLGTTMIYVTHDQLEAMSMADTIAVMHEGELQQLGTPARGLQQAGQCLGRGLRRRAGDEFPHLRRARRGRQGLAHAPEFRDRAEAGAGEAPQWAIGRRKRSHGRASRRASISRSNVRPSPPSPAKSSSTNCSAAT